LVADVPNLGELELGIGENLPNLRKKRPKALVSAIDRAPPEHG
jgi:hypothetical protein